MKILQAAPLRVAVSRSPSPVHRVAAQPSHQHGLRLELLASLLMWFQLGYMVLTFSWGTIKDTGGFQANPVSRFVKLALLLLGLIVIISRLRIAVNVLRRTNPYFLAFLALVPISLLWSIDPDSTAARCVSMASMMAVCLSLNVTTWKPTRFQDVIRPVITLMLLASLIAGLIAPDFVIEQGDTASLEGAWHGLTLQKNIFGMLASFGVIFWLHAWITHQQRALLSGVGLGVSIACLVLSRSSTSLMATVFVSVLMLLLLRPSPGKGRYRRFIILLFAGCTLLYGLAVMSIIPGTETLLTPITAVTGKDDTFSARTKIWSIVRQNIRKHPLVGSGYNAYWGGGPVRTSPSYQFLKKMYFWPSESHNGYLEVRNDLGILGIFVLFGYFYIYLKQSFRLMPIDRNQAILFLALFFQQAVTNLSESTWFFVDNFSFVIMSTATIALSRSLLQQRNHLLDPISERASTPPKADAVGMGRQRPPTPIA